jgi:exodeoxyribonuclease-1
MGLVFYDTETTGTEPAFDQVLQFAAIHTNSELEVIERFNIRCRLLPHIVPSPGAMRITRTPCTDLEREDLPSHYAMVQEIYKKLASWSPATFIGYNSISFDEHVLRQAFYQTLHPPYLTSTPGCARCDVMRLVQAASLISPTALVIPRGEDGELQFKLEGVARANGFAHVNAHDALADVEATIHLARLLKERTPNLWSDAMRFSAKAAAAYFISEEPVFCASQFYFGKPYAWTLTMIGSSPENAGDLFVFDLSNDPEELAQLEEEDLVDRLAAYPKPVRTIKTNAAPCLLLPDDGQAFTAAADLSAEEVERRVEWIAANDAFRERLVAAYVATKPVREPSPHVERQLYDSFVSDADWELAWQFHAASWEDRIGILSQISDRRLRLLGKRLLFTERPDLFDDKARAAYARGMARRLMGSEGDVPWLTLPRAIEELDEILSEAGALGAEHLVDHRAWLEGKSAGAAAIAGEH